MTLVYISSVKYTVEKLILSVFLYCLNNAPGALITTLINWLICSAATMAFVVDIAGTIFPATFVVSNSDC